MRSVGNNNNNNDNNDIEYDAYVYGHNYMNISFYLNHSLTPNMTTVIDLKFKYYVYVTSRDIKKGEELLLNYEIFNNN